MAGGFSRDRRRSGRQPGSGKQPPDGLKSIFITRVDRKEPEEFEGKYCHPYMCKFDFRVAEKLRVAPEFLEKLKIHDGQAWAQLRRMVVNRGLHGELIVQYNSGGPGRPCRWAGGKDNPAWKARAARSGAREIGRLHLRRQEQDNMEIGW